ncbi:hypothetical protein M0Q28_01630 [Patescibacteria group bacterium]|jgi:hypothetical protein|nr:hypothetical protein [Patescibacteria group bacterium]
MLKRLFVLFYAFLDRGRDRPRRGKSPQDFTLDEVEALPWGHPALMSIACTHMDPATACVAASKLKQTEQIRILLISQEAQLSARLTVVDRLGHDEQLMLRIALSHDHAELAERAAHHVKSPFCVKRLQQSAYPSVRIVGLLKTRDPLEIERILKDADARVRERALAHLAKTSRPN